MSEGSAFTLLQKQQAAESPLPGRRAKSLDAPVIPVTKLPPLNAFSSKDDTVEEEDHVIEEKIMFSSMETTTQDSEKESDAVHEESGEEKQYETEQKRVEAPPPDVVPKSDIPKAKESVKTKTGGEKEKPKKLKEKQKSGEKDQIVPDVTLRHKKTTGRPTVQTKSTAQKPTTLKPKPVAPPRTTSNTKPPIKEKVVQKPAVPQKITPAPKTSCKTHYIKARKSPSEISINREGRKDRENFSYSRFPTIA